VRVYSKTFIYLFSYRGRSSLSKTELSEPPTNDDASDESVFVYPEEGEEEHEESPQEQPEEPPEDDDDNEEFVYPGDEQDAQEVQVEAPARQPHASPAQLESLYAAASSGDLPLLKRLFSSITESGEIDSFSLSNDASPRTGFTALHAAASRGYLDIVKWRACYAFTYFDTR
jgi:hypothetical protein